MLKCLWMEEGMTANSRNVCLFGDHRYMRWVGGPFVPPGQPGSPMPAVMGQPGRQRGASRAVSLNVYC